MFHYLGRVIDSGAPSLLRARAPQGYFAYAVAGVALAPTLTATVANFSRDIRQAQLTGVLEALLVAPAPSWVIVLWGSLWSTARNLLRTAACLAIAAMAGVSFRAASWPWVALTLVLTVAALAPLGMLAATFVVLFKRAEPIAHVTNAAAMFLAGTYFPLELLPGWLAKAAWAFPLTHAIAAFRCALFATGSNDELEGHLSCLAVFALTLGPVSLWAFDRAVRWSKRRGSLGQY
jgi:ABC-2 type transport system permease protein